MGYLTLQIGLPTAGVSAESDPSQEVPQWDQASMKKIYSHAVHLLNSGQYEDAIQEFEKILTVKPDHHPSLIRVGEAKAALIQIEGSEEKRTVLPQEGVQKEMPPVDAQDVPQEKPQAIAQSTQKGGSPAESKAASSRQRVPHRLGIGVNFNGVQIRSHFLTKWAGEVRFLKAEEDFDTGSVDSEVFGLRVYRFLGKKSRFQFFVGTELAVIQSEQDSRSVKSSGYAAGGFGGLQYNIGKRFAFGLDVGPYFISLESDTQSVSNTSVEFVASTFIIFYML